MRAARLGVFEFFEDDAARALAHDETVAIPIVGARGFLGLIVEAGRKRAAGGKARHREAIDRRFGAARDHHIRVAQRNQPPGVADRMGAGRTRGHDRMIGAFQLMRDRDIAAGQIDQPPGNEERRNAARALFVERDRGVVNAAEAADARADQDAGFDFFLIGRRRPFGVAQRLRRRAHRIDDEIVDPALFLGVHPFVGTERVFGVAARHLGGDAAGNVGNVETPGSSPRRIRRRSAGARSPRRRKRAA